MENINKIAGFIRKADNKYDTFLNIKYQPWYKGSSILKVIDTNEKNIKIIFDKIKKMSFTSVKFDKKYNDIIIVDKKPDDISKESMDADVVKQKKLFNEVIDMLKEYGEAATSSSFQHI